MKIWDISPSIKPGMVLWPEDPELEIDRIKDMARGDRYSYSTIRMGLHAGSHVDAPAHFIAGGATVDAISFDQLLGPAMVLEIPDAKAISPEHLMFPEGTERLLLKTINHRLWNNPDFQRDFAYLTPEGADFLVEKGVKLVGIDYLSIGEFKKGDEAHKRLLGNGIAVLETLDLRNVEAGTYELICLPLKLEGTEAAPVRAILRSL